MAELPEGIRSHVVWVPLLWPARSARASCPRAVALPHSHTVMALELRMESVKCCWDEEGGE